MPYEPYAVGLWVTTKYATLRIYFINGKIVENAGHRTACTCVFSVLINSFQRILIIFSFLIAEDLYKLLILLRLLDVWTEERVDKL